MADKLREDRRDIEEQVALAAVGYRIWTERRLALARWARVGLEDLEDWWLHGRPTVQDHDRQRQFVKAVGFTAADLALLEEDLGRGWERFVIPRLRSNLISLAHLEILRALARKTWPADPRDRVGWTEDELGMVNYFYREQEPGLFGRERGGVYDPFELEVISVEGSLGFGMGDLTYCLYVLLRATVIDFADDLFVPPSSRGRAARSGASSAASSSAAALSATVSCTARIGAGSGPPSAATALRSSSRLGDRGASPLRSGLDHRSRPGQGATIAAGGQDSVTAEMTQPRRMVSRW